MENNPRSHRQKVLFHLLGRQGGSLESTVGFIKAEICSVHFGLNERPPGCAGRRLMADQGCVTDSGWVPWDAALPVPEVPAPWCTAGSGVCPGAAELPALQGCTASQGCPGLGTLLSSLQLSGHHGLCSLYFSSWATLASFQIIPLFEEETAFCVVCM